VRILVTGATGFIGSNLIESLLMFDHEIIATSRDSSKAIKKTWYNNVTFIEFNIQGDSSLNLFEYFQKPDIIIHLSWSGLPNYNSISHIENNLWDNYYFLKNLITNGATNITVTGTCFEYGMDNGEMFSSRVTNPSNSYSIAKDTLRKFLVLLQNEYTYNLKWLRLFYLFGEFQSEHSLYRQLVQDIENNSEYFNMSAGEQIRDFLPVEEAVKQIIKFSVETNSSILANICSGKPVSVRSFVENIIYERKSKIKINLGHFKYSDFEPLAFWGRKE
jgi:nucleoside-diphosphate-sugar epimerase